MHVETYEVTETNPETGLSEFEPETLALIEELGLDGQQRLIHRRTVDGDEEVATLCPYREMTAEEEHVYEYLLPTKLSLDAYDRGPVPLRVLQVAALAQREAWFDGGLSVRCPATVRDKDPLLIGEIKEKYGAKKFILARWGEVLLPFEELQATAQRRWIAEKRAELEEKLAAVESAAAKHFAGERVYGY